jgi:hypothetical protein
MSVLTVDVQQPVEKPRPASRIEALDWTKGALVLCMVVYHAINYSAFRPMAFRFLGFLPSSFILIAGFLVGQVYAAKYDLKTWKPYLRLAVRGFKLLVLFLVLNVAYCIILERNFLYGIMEFADRSNAIFLSGNGREGIFEVLLPIAYFLLLAPALLWLRSRVSGAIIFCAAGIFLLCVALEMNGLFYKNLSLLSAGLLGMACGLIPMASTDRFACRWLPVLGVYAFYRLCSYFVGEIYVVQMLGALISLTLIYTCALHLDCASTFGRQMVLFGRYTLLGYLVQIPLIQIIVSIFGGKPDHWLGVSVVTVVATVLLFFIILAVHELRRRSRFIDLSYKSIFA